MRRWCQVLSRVCHKLLNPEPGTPEKRESVKNFLKTMCFACPEWIPGNVALMQATWMRYGDELEKIVLEHPRLFPGYREGSFRDMKLTKRTSRGTWTDAWGVKWQNEADGLDSIPLEEEAPLRDWSALDTLEPPDPETTDDWGGKVDFAAARENFARAKQAGGLAIGGLPHGFMYMRLYYLRGFSNLMMDIAMRDPRLDRLIEVVTARNERIVQAWVEAGAEIIWAGDDLGLQTALPISPEDWRRYIKPAYWRIFAPCRELGLPVYLHTDGHVIEIIADLMECGITILNPQVRANGLEALAAQARGKLCIHLDLDRQLFPFATPEQIRAHIHEALEALNTPEGGLMLHAECEPDVPLENIRAICDTFEEVGVGPFL